MPDHNYKAPPALSKASTYELWLKEIKIWQTFTDIAAERQAPAIFLTLEGKAREAALELDVAVLAAADGVKNLIAKLDELFLKDKAQQAYAAYDEFERFKRPETMNMCDYINEFNRLLNKTKAFGTTMSDNILAYRLLKSANLSEQHEQLARATIGDLTFDAMKSQLRKIFAELPGSSSHSDHGSELPVMHPIKVEPVLHTKHESECFVDQEEEEFVEDVYYGSDSSNWRSAPRHPAIRGNSRFASGRGMTRGRFRNYPRRGFSARGKNPVDSQGRISRCSICESVNHWASACPDNSQYVTSDVQVTLFQSHHENNMKHFVGDCFNHAILDCGASKTVCGDTWLECYMDSLDEGDKGKVRWEKSDSSFRFGDGPRVQAMKSVYMPAQIGPVDVMIHSHVVASDVPLLFSKRALQNANAIMNFKTDTVSMLGNPQPFITTPSGHCAIPLSRKVDALENKDVNVTFAVTENPDPARTALKLHRQFAHPTCDKLLKLIKNSVFKDDTELKKEIVKVSLACQICQKHKRPPPRPVVGLPLAQEFNDCVAMDLKQFGSSVWFLHLIDHATRFSASCVVTSKRKEVIIQAIFKIWISIFGPPQTFLSDNGGEFNNKEFHEMCESLNITVKTTAAESPWSNGLCERHNLMLSEAVSKTMADVGCSVDIALAWGVNAKNSLQNVHGFSPYQLVFGRTPTLPSLEYNKLPALNRPASEIVASHLDAMHRARKAFLESESSEKIRRALHHNIRSGQDVKYCTGDRIYYRRDNAWRGPAKVLGQDGQLVLVKHGGIYVRVHPCHLMLVNSDESDRSDVKADAATSKDDCSAGDSESEDEEHAEAEDHSNQSPPVATAPLQPSARTSLSLPKKNMLIEYRDKDHTEQWIRARVVSRAGKATGKYRNIFNIQRHGEDDICEVDFEHDVVQWKEQDSEHGALDSFAVCMNNSAERSEDLVLLSNVVQESVDQDILNAKKQELCNWIQQDVYEEVDDVGQACISTRWVLTTKDTDKGPRSKARLVARGFEEDSVCRADSPTCMRDSLRILLSVAAAKGWCCRALDIKAAFLQGKTIDRELFLRPPKEANVETKIWRLKKCVYGLADASRVWYLRVRDVLCQLGMSVSSCDPAMFFRHSLPSKLDGLIVCHVDDFLWTGSEQFEQVIISELRRAFCVGHEEEGNIKYLGLNLEQHKDLYLDQCHYIAAIRPIQMHQQTDGTLSPEQKSQLRSVVGQLNWVHTQSRPDIGFDVSEVISHLNKASVEGVKKANRIVKRLQHEEVKVKFARISLSTARVYVMADAGYANLPDGGSQAGFLIFLADEDGNCCPITWQSNKVKRVVRSALAAETLALVEASGAAWLVANICGEVFTGKKDQLPIVCFTDNKSLYDAVHTSNMLTDKRLRVDMSALREMVEKGEIKVNWIPAQLQLADVLTKKGASSASLLHVFRTGRLKHA